LLVPHLPTSPEGPLSPGTSRWARESPVHSFYPKWVGGLIDFFRVFESRTFFARLAWSSDRFSVQSSTQIFFHRLPFFLLVVVQNFAFTVFTLSLQALSPAHFSHPSSTGDPWRHWDLKFGLLRSFPLPHEYWFRNFSFPLYSYH